MSEHNLLKKTGPIIFSWADDKKRGDILHLVNESLKN